MPYNSFPLFGEYDQNYRLANLAADNDDDYVPDVRSAVRAWGIAALLVGGLFVALIVLVPRIDQKPAGLEGQLPAGYQTTVAALVRATANDCPQVCSVARGPAADGSLIVGCSRAQTAGSCTNAARYEIRVGALSDR
jgi:hypothetical protein